MTDEQDLIAYLTSKGAKVYRAAGAEITTHCLFCPDGDTKGKGKLYLSTESWLWECKRCGTRGNRRTLLEHYGDEDALKHAAGADPMTRRRVLTEAAALAHEMLLANERKVQYLLDRGIAPELIVEAQLGYVPKNVGLSEMLPNREAYTYKDLVGAGLISIGGKEFFNDCLTIPYHSHGTVIQIRAKYVDGKYRTAGGDHVRLYNADALHGVDQVLITEGEYDGLAIRSSFLSAPERALEPTAVVGLPGAGSWPEGLIPALSSARRVFIGLDPDETGRKYAEKLREEIGNRARVVHLPDGEPKTDWTDWLRERSDAHPHGGHTWRDVQQLLVEADLAGKQMFSVRDAFTKWSRRQKQAPGLKLGFASFDAIIRPGVKPGQVMIPLARTGTGKTVFLSNIAFNLRRKRVLFLSLEMTAAEVFEHLRRIHHFWYPAAAPDAIVRDLANLQIVERNRLGRGDVEDLITEYTELVGAPPELVILDYLQYYARGFRGSSMYDRVSDAVMELKAIAKDRDVAICAPSQVSRGSEDGRPLTLDAARDAGTIEETGDFVVSLFRPDLAINKDDPSARAPETGRFHLQILKSRHGGVGRVVHLLLSPMSLVIVDPLFDKAASTRVQQEASMSRRGIHYDDYRAQTAQQSLDLEVS